MSRCRILARVLFPFILLAGSAPKGLAECISYSEAMKHIGATKCVTGKVLRVKQGNSGVHFFDFCEDYRGCPFTVVVFPGDLKRVGDIRGLQGRQIEIEGEVKGYDGRAEIILRRVSQLRGEAGRIPPLPREYDVERRGKYSAGKFSYPKAAKRSPHKKQTPPMKTEDPSEPWSPTD